MRTYLLPSFGRPVEGGFEISAPAAGIPARRGANKVVVPAEKAGAVIVLEASHAPRYNQGILRVEGPAVAWSYGDDHGQTLVVVLKRGATFTAHWSRESVTYTVPTEGTELVRVGLPESGAKRLEL